MPPKPVSASGRGAIPSSVGGLPQSSGILSPRPFPCSRRAGTMRQAAPQSVGPCAGVRGISGRSRFVRRSVRGRFHRWFARKPGPSARISLPDRWIQSESCGKRAVFCGKPGVDPGGGPVNRPIFFIAWNQRVGKNSNGKNMVVATSVAASPDIGAAARGKSRSVDCMLFRHGAVNDVCDGKFTIACGS